MPQETNKARLEKMLKAQSDAEKATIKGGFISLKEEGDHLIRILPRVKVEDPTEPYFVQRWIHFVKIPGEGTRMVLCRQRGVGEPCPVCEYMSHIQEHGTEEEKKVVAEWGTGNKEYLIFRALDEDNQVKLYAYNKQSVNVEILKLTVEYETKGLPADSQQKGYWININRVGKTRNDTRYTVKAVKVIDPADPTSERLKLDDLTGKTDILMELGNLPDIGEQFKYRSYDETKHYFETGEKDNNGDTDDTKEQVMEKVEEKPVINKPEEKKETKVAPEKKWDDFLKTSKKK